MSRYQSLIESHNNCVKHFNEKIQTMEKEIESLRNENAVLKEQIATTNVFSCHPTNEVKKFSCDFLKIPDEKCDSFNLKPVIHNLMSHINDIIATIVELTKESKATVFLSENNVDFSKEAQNINSLEAQISEITDLLSTFDESTPELCSNILESEEAEQEVVVLKENEDELTEESKENDHSSNDHSSNDHSSNELQTMNSSEAQIGDSTFDKSTPEKEETNLFKPKRIVPRLNSFQGIPYIHPQKCSPSDPEVNDHDNDNDKNLEVCTLGIAEKPQSENISIHIVDCYDLISIM